MERAAWWLVVIGAINWLLVGLFQFDLVQAVGNSVFADYGNLFSRVVYVLVGVAGIYLLPRLFGVQVVRKK
ncbi:DUF378 domain-containing protein [Alicyclobacillus tolerans]|uniref:Uncharacterized membrane protein YuzA (DUF378 family) n=2 Tax=Alicyclobacillus tolerans TaxID=90970 RepID=A0ABT9LXS5_9BACL|nr:MULTISPECIES: DUF378 domain-containing protein [Alicyclobacillus]MDP9729069.1 uncharacterized membrane protein YuzA (DUF378 family) [Alicyclobacillus tengchongensis]SHK90421.1 hypothetical protein SAMN05443507_12631 [Alicyclobacillus montanus]